MKTTKALQEAKHQKHCKNLEGQMKTTKALQEATAGQGAHTCTL